MRSCLLLVAALLPLNGALASPSDEDPSGRRAIRGEPVEITRESDELRQMRIFEEESFPRGYQALPPSAATPLGYAAGAPGEAHPAASAPPEPLVSPRHNAAPPATITPTAVPWLAGLALPDFAVRFDPHVVRYLEFYRDDPRGRSIIKAWFKNQGRYRSLIESALAKARLPQSLLYVTMIESGYNPLDRSQAGAVGLWQLMPDGARIYGLRMDYWVDERRDPDHATDATMRYWSDLKARFGSWPLALAAFNAGYGAVLRAMAKYNTNDYWELCRHENGLPWETTLYVPKVMATAIVGANRASFGLADLKEDAPLAYEIVIVPSSMSLQNIARSAGVTLEQLNALNPELRRGRTPPEPWQIKLPPGSRERFAASYERYRERLQPHVIRFGERLDEIARVAGASRSELKRINGIGELSELRNGMTLLVPDGRAALPLPPAEELIIVAVPDKDAQELGHKRVFYRVLPGDSLDDIAKFFRVSMADLSRWNRLDPTAKLSSKMVLQIWLARNFDETQAALLDPGRVYLVTTGSQEFFDLIEMRNGRKRVTYKVRPKDTFKRIAARFRFTEGDVERINRMSRKSQLTVGQSLMIYVPMNAKDKLEAQKKWRDLIEDARKQSKTNMPATEKAAPKGQPLPMPPAADDLNDDDPPSETNDAPGAPGERKAGTP